MGYSGICTCLPVGRIPCRKMRVALLRQFLCKADFREESHKKERFCHIICCHEPRTAKVT